MKNSFTFWVLGGPYTIRERAQFARCIEHIGAPLIFIKKNNDIYGHLNVILSFRNISMAACRLPPNTCRPLEPAAWLALLANDSQWPLERAAGLLVLFGTCWWLIQRSGSYSVVSGAHCYPQITRRYAPEGDPMVHELRGSERQGSGGSREAGTGCSQKVEAAKQWAPEVGGR